jgi:hypothetical protein
MRVGDTVRRLAGPWTSAVHALLAYLADQGFTGARGRSGSMSRAGRCSASWRARPSGIVSRGLPGCMPRTPWSRSLAGCATTTRSPLSSSRRPVPSDARAHLVTGPDHRPQRRDHPQCCLAPGQDHRVLRLGLRRACHAGVGSGPGRLHLGAAARPVSCRRRGVHRLRGQAPPARPVPRHLRLVRNHRGVPRCG